MERTSVDNDVTEILKRLDALERVARGESGDGIRFDAENVGGALQIQTDTGNIDLDAQEEQVNLYGGEIGLYSKLIGASSGDVGLYSERDTAVYSDRDAALNANRDATVVAGAQGTLGGDVVIDAKGGSYANGRVTLSAVELVVLNAGLGMRVEIDPSGVLTVFTSGGTEPLFRIDVDGALHGKTGQALTFDL